MAEFDAGGSPAAPYFGEGGRQEANEKAREDAKKGAPSATAGAKEAADSADGSTTTRYDSKVADSSKRSKKKGK